MIRIAVQDSTFPLLCDLWRSTQNGWNVPYPQYHFFSTVLSRCIILLHCTLYNTVTNCLIHFISPGNSLLLNSSMQPDLTVSRTYSGPICLQDPMDKELMTESSLFNPLSDIKVKVQSSFMVSLGVTERAEYPGKARSGTFPHGNARGFGTMQARNKAAYIQNLSSISTRNELKTTAIFGHLGGRLVVPNTGE